MHRESLKLLSELLVTSENTHIVLAKVLVILLLRWKVLVHCLKVVGKMIHTYISLGCQLLLVESILVLRVLLSIWRVIVIAD